MIERYRRDFNARFTPEKYAAFLQLLDERVGAHVEFRVAETPCFLAAGLLEDCVRAGVELTAQLLGNTHYMQESNTAVPDAFCAAHQDAHPHFMTVDFGLVRNADGSLQPKLVEMQAFPSLYGYQPVLSQTYIDAFDLDPSLGFYLGGLDDDSYWALLSDVILGGHAPENVVLAEVEPEAQKTRADFRVYEKRLGIHTMDIAKLVKQGRDLFYRDEAKDGRLTPVHRIYNRAIVDEIVHKGIELPFDFRDDLSVEWAGHPNWYFRISKFSIPHLDHPCVPPAVLLSDWLDGVGRDRLPEDRSEWVFKPLYSFAGKGIQFAPADSDLAAIAPADRGNYLLQQRMHFEPIIHTPEGPTQAEIRILYVWPNERAMVPMTSLVRMGRGLMMGVDHNRDRTWVGGTAGLSPTV